MNSCNLETGTFDRPWSVEEKKGKTNESENKINLTPSRREIKKENALNIWEKYKRRENFKSTNAATVLPIHRWNSADSPS